MAHRITLLLARVAVSAIFVLSGYFKLVDQEGTRMFMESAPIHLPNIPLLMWIAIAIEIAGPVLLIAGYQTQKIAAFLAVYLLLITLVFHTDFSTPLQLTMFFKNMGIAGGLLLIAMHEQLLASASSLPPPPATAHS